MEKQNIGVIGLGLMGKNLALNIESRGFSVCYLTVLLKRRNSS